MPHVLEPDCYSEQNMNSYAVRCVIEIPKQEFNTLAFLYEERITVWQAADIDEAIDKAIGEVEAYSTKHNFSYTGLSQGYQMLSQIDLDGVEVFSLLRESDLSPEEYLDTFFSTGSERQADKKANNHCSRTV